MYISSYYDCNFCAVYMQFICSVFYEIMKCYMQTTILHIHSTEVRPKAKSQVKPKPKKQQKPKTKSQESSEAKAKSQMGMQIGSKLQQIARKSEILVPKCSKYKPEARNRRSQKPKPNGQQMGMQIGSKLQQIARKSEILAPKCSKYKLEARNRRSQKPKAKWACKLAPNCCK